MPENLNYPPEPLLEADWEEESSAVADQTAAADPAAGEDALVKAPWEKMDPQTAAKGSEELEAVAAVAGKPEEFMAVQEMVESLPDRHRQQVLTQTLRYGGAENPHYADAGRDRFAEFREKWDAGQEAREHKIMTADYPMKVVLEDLTRELNARDFVSGRERQEFAAQAVDYCIEPLLQPDTPEQQEQLRHIMTQFLGSYPGVIDRNHDLIFISEKMQEALYPRPEKDPAALEGLPPLTDFKDPANPRAILDESLRRVRLQIELETDPVQEFLGVVAMTARRANDEEKSHFSAERYAAPGLSPNEKKVLSGLFAALEQRYPDNIGHTDWTARHWSGRDPDHYGLGDLSKVFDNQAFYSKEHRLNEARALTDAVLGPPPDPATSHPLDRLPHALLLSQLNHAGRQAGQEHFSGGLPALTAALDWQREKLYGASPYDFLQERIQRLKNQAEKERAEHNKKYRPDQYGGSMDPTVHHPRQLAHGMTPEIRVVLGAVTEQFARTFAAVGLEPSGSLNFPGPGHEQFQPNWIEVNPGEQYACAPEELDRRQMAAALADALATRSLRHLLKDDEYAYQQDADRTELLDRRVADALNYAGEEATAFSAFLRRGIARAGLDEKAEPNEHNETAGLYEKTCDVLYIYWEEVKKERDNLYQQTLRHPDPATRVLAREVLNGGNLVYAPKPGDWLTYVHSPPEAREPQLYPLLKKAAQDPATDPRLLDPAGPADPDWNWACDHYGDEPLTNGQVADRLVARDQGMQNINRNTSWIEPPWANELYKAGARIDAARLLLNAVQEL